MRVRGPARMGMLLGWYRVWMVGTRFKPLVWLPILMAVVLLACSAPPSPRAAAPSGATTESPTATTAARPGRTLVVAIRLEPSSLATRPLRQAGVGLYLTSRMFNAEIAKLDDHGQTQPYLVESLP